MVDEDWIKCERPRGICDMFNRCEREKGKESERERACVTKAKEEKRREEKEAFRGRCFQREM